MSARRKRIDETTGAFDEDSYDDDFFGYDEDDWEPRPEWLHPDCRNVCAALELGTCCKYPDNPLVRVAVEFADAVDRTLRGAENEDRARIDAELTRQFRLVPGLLAQIHAILPRLTRTALAQLLCPVGLLAAALDQVRGDGHAEFAPVIGLVAECSAAIRMTLGRPVVVARRQRRSGG
jgi:hypothetical protein